MGKNELSEAGTSMVRDNMANFRRDTRKTRVTGYPGVKACYPIFSQSPGWQGQFLCWPAVMMLSFNVNIQSSQSGWGYTAVRIYI